jgi:hypothetical protein
MAMGLQANIELQGLHNQRIKLGEHIYIDTYIFSLELHVVVHFF